MTKFGSSRSCSKTIVAMFSFSPTEKRAGTLYSRTLMTSIDFVTFPGSRVAADQPNPRIHPARRRWVSAGPDCPCLPWARRRRAVCEAVVMHSIQIADETFVAADGARVGAAVADRASWRRWWPDLRLQVVEDRGDKGIRWSVTGALTGTMEVWLEPLKEGLDGVVLHYFLHAEPTGVAAWQLAKLNLAKMTHRRRVAGKKMAFEVKTTLERSRPVGVSPVV